MPEFIIYRHDRGRPDAELDRGDSNKRPVARVQANDAADACRIAAKQLTLVVDFGERGDVQDDVDWVDARLIKN